MKSYQEMAERVFARRDAYNARRNRQIAWVQRGTAAVACVCLAALLWAGNIGRRPAGQDAVVDFTAPVQEQQMSENAICSGTLSEENRSQPAGEDVPADEAGAYWEAVDVDSLPQGTAAYFGGSYTGDAGRFVVVLTEDTPAHRAEIAGELGVREADTVFVTGDYTLIYLTALQEKISEAMAAGALPSVVSSGVYEAENCIRVIMLAEDRNALAALDALDTLGGAIEVEYAAGGVTKDLLVTTEEDAVTADAVTPIPVD